MNYSIIVPCCWVSDDVCNKLGGRASFAGKQELCADGNSETDKWNGCGLSAP